MFYVYETIKLGNLLQNGFYLHYSSYYSSIPMEMLQALHLIPFYDQFSFCSYEVLQIDIYLYFENL